MAVSPRGRASLLSGPGHLRSPWPGTLPLARGHVGPFPGTPSDRSRPSQPPRRGSDTYPTLELPLFCLWFPYWDGRLMGAEAVNLRKGRDEEGKKEMKAGRSAPCPRGIGGVAGGEDAVAGLGGCWPGSRGWRGRVPSVARGQAGSTEKRSGRWLRRAQRWVGAGRGGTGQASGQEQCVQRPSARRPGSRLERSGQGTLVIPGLLTFPGQLKA